MAACLVTAAPVVRAEEPEMEEEGGDTRPADAELSDSEARSLQESRDVREASRLRWSVPVEATTLAGYLDGRKVRRESGAVAVVEVSTDPRLEAGPLTLSLPLGLRHQETFGAHLRELHSRGALEARLAIGESFWVEPAGSVTGAWRPGWTDLYQPIPEQPAAPPAEPTEFNDTDRYSYFAYALGARARWRPAAGHAVTFEYDYKVANYRNDSAFRSVLDTDPEPNHLVPPDYSRHGFELAYAYRSGVLRAEAGVEAFFKDSEFIYARDAGTGLTHAAPGGAAANPLQSLRGAEPRAEVELRFFRKRLRVEAGFGWEVVDDTFQGYYSYAGPHPSLRVRGAPTADLDLGLQVEAQWRTYGANSYAATPGWQPGDAGHPPLEGGNRRTDHRVGVDLDTSYALNDTWRLLLEAKLLWRDTNFPNYQPGVFPRTRNYAIEWSYTNWQVLAGLAWRVDLGG
jgi:hypothetical protein